MDNYFEKKTTYNQITFRYARGKSLMDGNEIHPYHEILYYIDGGADFLSEEFHEELALRSLVIIPKESYHCFRIKNQSSYKRLVINFSGVDGAEKLVSKLMSRIRIIKDIPGEVSQLLVKICSLLQNDSDSEEAQLMLYGAFLMLLSLLSTDNSREKLQPRSENELIFKCTAYIEQHFKSEISAETIARDLHVSVSTLFHCFKKELGISLHKYITQKRLIYAHRLLSENVQPSKVCFECGYNNYTAFYKAYVKMFGISPSGEHRRVKNHADTY